MMEHFLKKISCMRMIVPQDDRESFAFHTMHTRVPTLLLDVIEHNACFLKKEQRDALSNLYEQMRSNQRVPLLPMDSLGGDATEWNALWEARPDATW